MSAAFYTQATAASFLAAEHLGADPAKIGWWFFAFPIGFMTGSFISGRIGAKRSIEFMTILGGVIGVINGGLLVAWFYFGGISMAALYIPGTFVSLAQGFDALCSSRRDGGRSGAFRLSVRRGGVLAVFLAGRAAAAHRRCSPTAPGCRWRQCIVRQSSEPCSPHGWRCGQRDHK